MSNYQQFRILKTNAFSKVGRPQKGMRQPKKPVSFEQWFLIGIIRQEKKGAYFTLYPGFVRIQWPGRPAVLRTVADFKREYYSEYLSKFYI